MSRISMSRIAAWAYSGVYVVFLCAFVVLMVLSIREEVPPFARDPPILRPVRKMAAFLYRKTQARRTKRRKEGRDLRIPGEEGVRSDLSVLYPSLQAQRKEVRYRFRKIERILLLLFLVCVTAGGMHFHALCSGILRENRFALRDEAGGEDRRLRVKALPEMDPEPEKEPGTYTVTVRARQYSYAESRAMAQEILRRYPEELLGENPSADRIRLPLCMPEASSVKPFSISWESSRYAVLDTDGSIFNREYAKEQAEEAELTVTLQYAGYQFRKKMAFTVRAPVRDEEEQLREEIGAALRSAEEESVEQERFVLPDKAGSIALSWEEQTEDISAGILVLGLTACVLAWYIMDRQLHEQVRKRNRQLLIDYPQFISRIVLYMGAGMSVRNVFYTCAAKYAAQTGSKGNADVGADGNSGKGRADGSNGKTGKTVKDCRRSLGEEILLVCNELDSGIPEAEAYMHFGRRCRSRQYSKLCSLLVRNLRRGNDTLLQVLQEEARISFEERKNLARELGEEADTKLLLPMMIMLAVTMLIIIVPAYFSFSA